MADYLNNLITRNLFPHEGIQPRPLSRFELSPDVFAVPTLSEMSQEGETQPIAPAYLPTAVTLESQRKNSLDERQSQPLHMNSQAFQVERSGNSEESMALPDAPLLRSSTLNGLVPPNFLPSDPVFDPSPQRPYRGRLDVEMMLPLEPQPQPASREEPLQQGVPAQLNVPLPTSRPDPLLEPSKRQFIESDQTSSRHPVHALNLPANAVPQEREHRIGRIVERSLITSEKSTFPALQEDYKPHSSITDVHTIPRQSATPEPAIQVLRPIVPPLPDLTTPNEVPQPSTTVNVTIGRIEVRAMPLPPRSPRRQSPASTTMSLDQYLQNRTSGDQR